MLVKRNGDVSPQGLTREEAETRLRQYGPNAVREAKPHLFLAMARKFWAPVPWMLEATTILELILGKRPEAVIIGFLLVFNAGLGFVQENRAQNALALLRKRLPVKARVLREGQWQSIPAEDLVPGDYIHVRMGDIMPADVRLADGDIQVDQSTLTGESLPLEAGSGQALFAGSVVIRGEASGEVTATGARTYFGKTAELVRTADDRESPPGNHFHYRQILGRAGWCSRAHPSSIFPARALAHDGNAALRPHVVGGLSSCRAAGNIYFGDCAGFHGTGRQRSARD